MKQNRNFSMVPVLVFLSGILLIPAAHGENYTYDDIGRLSKVTFDDDTSITYAYDNNGNVLAKTIEGLPDTTAPVITLVGTTPISIRHGEAYNDAGATANDDVDGDITANIVTTNSVNTAVSGVYTVTYDVSDSAGNQAVQVTRTINVAEPVVTRRKKPGGGCSISRSASFDPILILMTLISMIYLRRRNPVIGKN